MVGKRGSMEGKVRKVWWVHVRQKVEPSFVAGVGITVARARSFTPVLFLFLTPFRLSPFSLYSRVSCLSFRSPFPLPRCSRAILLPLPWTLVCRSSLLFPLCHSAPFHLRRYLCCSPFHRDFFSSIFFAFFLPLDLYSHPTQHLLQLGYPTRVALVSLLRFSLFYCSPSFLNRSLLSLLISFFLVLFFYFLFLFF